MPVKRCDGGQKLNDELRSYLLEGFDFFGDFSHQQEATKRAWRSHREDLLAEWRELKGSFCRPAGWWLYEAPEMRRRIERHGVAAVEKADCPAWAKKWRFGIPCIFDRQYGPGDGPQYETERIYLCRHAELLTAEEARTLKERTT